MVQINSKHYWSKALWWASYLGPLGTLCSVTISALSQFVLCYHLYLETIFVLSQSMFCPKLCFVFCHNWCFVNYVFCHNLCFITIWVSSQFFYVKIVFFCHILHFVFCHNWCFVNYVFWHNLCFIKIFLCQNCIFLSHFAFCVLSQFVYCVLSQLFCVLSPFFDVMFLHSFVLFHFQKCFALE